MTPQSAPDKPFRVLLVEDEEHLAAGVKLNLELEGYHADIATSGRDAAHLLLDPRGYDVIVLDVMLPDINGFTLCEKLRQSGNVTPILMLTARDSVTDRVSGLNVGADDYLTKPFELAELLARVRSLLRRRRWEQASEIHVATGSFRLNDVTVNFETHEVQRNGEDLHLTKLELDLLRYFINNPHRVLSREELQQNVWKLRDYPNRRMVDNFIMRLRRHFEPDPSKPIYFVSVRGAGYKFDPP